jgi:hypothetical protein
VPPDTIVLPDKEFCVTRISGLPEFLMMGGETARNMYSCPIASLNKPTGFQEVKAHRFLDIGT